MSVFVLLPARGWVSHLARMTPLRSSAPAPRSAPAAYRRDLAARRDLPFGDDDGAWITLATMLTHAAMQPGAGEALAAARTFVHDAWRGREPHPELDPPGRGGEGTVVRAAIEEMERSGALELARVALESLSAIVEDEVERGRVEAQRARIRWKLGDVEGAELRYRRVERTGRRLLDEELRIRAWLGYCALAQQKGNYPALRRWCLRVHRSATARGWGRLAAVAENGLMACEATAGNLDAAVEWAWRAYRHVAGDPHAESEVLQNLGYLLLLLGRPHPAKTALVAAIQRARVPRIIVPALGNLALAAAADGDRVTLDWAARELDRADPGVHQPYDVALSLLECARALQGSGDPARARRLRERALGIAARHGYHEIAIRAERPEPAAAPAAPARRALAVAAELESWTPALPDHVLQPL